MRKKANQRGKLIRLGENIRNNVAAVEEKDGKMIMMTIRIGKQKASWYDWPQKI